MIIILFCQSVAGQEETRTPDIDPTNLAGLSVGHDINIKTSSQGGMRGKVVDLTRDTITINRGRRDLRVSAGEIEMIERINPRSRGRTIAGGVVGGLAGLVAGSLTSYAVADGAPAATPYAILGVGAIIGAVVGAKIAGARTTVIYLRPGKMTPRVPSLQPADDSQTGGSRKN